MSNYEKCHWCGDTQNTRDGISLYVKPRESEILHKSQYNGGPLECVSLFLCSNQCKYNLMDRHNYVEVDCFGLTTGENEIHDEWVWDNRIKEFGSVENYYRHMKRVEAENDRKEAIERNKSMVKKIFMWIAIIALSIIVIPLIVEHWIAITVLAFILLVIIGWYNS